MEATSLVISSIFPVQKTDRPLRMMLDYGKLNQVVTPIAVAVADVASLLEQINTSSGPWFAAMALENASFWASVHKDHQK